MALETKPTTTSKQLVPVSNQQLIRVRTNLVPLKPIRLYVPDDDDSVPSTFALCRDMISTACGREEALLSGYFSALCAVLPDLTDVVTKAIKILGYQLEQTLIPSQAAAMKIVIPPSHDLRLEVLKFAQICLLPFQNKFDEDSTVTFWKEVAAHSGVNRAARENLCSPAEMRTISTSLLASGTIAEMRSRIASSMKALAAAGGYFAVVLPEAAKLNQRFSVYSGQKVYGYFSYDA